MEEALITALIAAIFGTLAGAVSSYVVTLRLDKQRETRAEIDLLREDILERVKSRKRLPLKGIAIGPSANPSIPFDPEPHVESVDSSVIKWNNHLGKYESIRRELMAEVEAVMPRKPDREPYYSKQLLWAKAELSKDLQWIETGKKFVATYRIEEYKKAGISPQPLDTRDK